jgi:2-C-methyl-D-erythritol 4-phosphate cytidylyltransferase
MKKFVIIVAGGSGSRMGSDIPKQFLELNEKPVLMHTMQVFYDYDASCHIILVLPPAQQGFWSDLCLSYHFSVPHQVVSGGETRFHSVRNGLEMINEDGIVFIHDGVRPLVSHQTIERCNQMAQKNGNAIPVLPVNDSLRKRKANGTVSVDRSLYYSVQTPQTFVSEQIKAAFKLDYDPAFTDDASVVEKAGFTVHLVEGNPENIKITTPTDFIIADAFMKP